jgi:hypothetical protein
MQSKWQPLTTLWQLISPVSFFSFPSKNPFCLSQKYILQKRVKGWKCGNKGACYDIYRIALFVRCLTCSGHSHFSIFFFSRCLSACLFEFFLNTYQDCQSGLPKFFVVALPKDQFLSFYRF